MKNSRAATLQKNYKTKNNSRLITKINKKKPQETTKPKQRSPDTGIPNNPNLLVP